MSFPLSNKVRYRLSALAETFRFDNRWQLLFEEIIFPRKLRIYRIGNIEVIVDHGKGDHLGGIRGVLGNEEYRTLLSPIEVNDLHNVLDLGAHIGGFPILLKILAARTKKFVCVEPNPGSLPKLQFNLFHNDVHAEIVAAAVSDRSGTVVLHAGATSTGFSLASDQPNRGEDKIEVAAKTFDEIVSEFFNDQIIDLCKMDIEGEEFAVIDGGHASKLRRCRHLICEIHPNGKNTVDSFSESVSKYGFKKQYANPKFENTILYTNLLLEAAK